MGSDYAAEALMMHVSDGNNNDCDASKYVWKGT